MRLTIRETVFAFTRTPVLSLLAIVTIGFALFVLGLFGLVAVNLREALTSIEERVEIVAYLTRGTPIEVVTVAMGDIRAFPEVATVRHVSSDEALEQARTQLTEFQGVFEDLEMNPLPASLEIRLKPGSRGADAVAEVADRMRGFRFVEDVRFGRDWIEKLDDLRNIAGLVGLAIGAGFMAAATIIIGTTIRMAVLARAREIQIMRLVGATDRFVRRPFLLDGAIKGTLGGMFAVALNYVAFLMVSDTLFQARFFSFGQWIGIVLFGLVVGFGASALSVGRHLSAV
jgi:cell division transport system permease protein